MVGVGSANGCTDVGGDVDTDTLAGITGNVTSGSFYVTPSSSLSGKLAPGDRIRIGTSYDVSFAYFQRQYAMKRTDVA